MFGCKEIIVAVAAVAWPVVAQAAEQRVAGRLAATSEVQVVGWKGLTLTIEPSDGDLVTVAVAADTQIDRNGRRVDPGALEPSDFLEVDYAQVRSGDVMVNQARHVRASSRQPPTRTRRGR